MKNKILSSTAAALLAAAVFVPVCSAGPGKKVAVVPEGSVATGIGGVGAADMGVSLADPLQTNGLNLGDLGLNPAVSGFDFASRDQIPVQRDALGPAAPALPALAGDAVRQEARTAGQEVARRPSVDALGSQISGRAVAQAPAAARDSGRRSEGGTKQGRAADAEKPGGFLSSFTNPFRRMLRGGDAGTEAAVVNDGAARRESGEGSPSAVPAAALAARGPNGLAPALAAPEPRPKAAVDSYSAPRGSGSSFWNRAAAAAVVILGYASTAQAGTQVTDQGRPVFIGAAVALPIAALTMVLLLRTAWFRSLSKFVLGLGVIAGAAYGTGALVGNASLWWMVGGLAAGWLGAILALYKVVSGWKGAAKLIADNKPAVDEARAALEGALEAWRAAKRLADPAATRADELKRAYEAAEKAVGDVGGANTAALAAAAVLAAAVSKADTADADKAAALAKAVARREDVEQVKRKLQEVQDRRPAAVTAADRAEAERVTAEQEAELARPAAEAPDAGEAAIRAYGEKKEALRVAVEEAKRTANVLRIMVDDRITEYSGELAQMEHFKELAEEALTAATEAAQDAKDELEDAKGADREARRKSTDAAAAAAGLDPAEARRAAGEAAAEAQRLILALNGKAAEWEAKRKALNALLRKDRWVQWKRFFSWIFLAAAIAAGVFGAQRLPSKDLPDRLAQARAGLSAWGNTLVVDVPEDGAAPAAAAPKDGAAPDSAAPTVVAKSGDKVAVPDSAKTVIDRLRAKEFSGAMFNEPMAADSQVLAATRRYDSIKGEAVSAVFFLKVTNVYYSDVMFMTHPAGNTGKVTLGVLNVSDNKVTMITLEGGKVADFVRYVQATTTGPTQLQSIRNKVIDGTLTADNLPGLPK